MLRKDDVFDSRYQLVGAELLLAKALLTGKPVTMDQLISCTIDHRADGGSLDPKGLVRVQLYQLGLKMKPAFSLVPTYYWTRVKGKCAPVVEKPMTYQLQPNPRGSFNGQEAHYLHGE